MHFSRTLSNLENVFFAKHLSMFLKAGVALPDALAALAEEGGSSSLGKIVRSIKIQIENGQPLHEALAKQPGSFDVFFVSMVEIGEVSGTLEKSLDFLADKLTRETTLRKKIQTMLYYPAVVVAVSTVIGAFLSFFVLPKLGTMFLSFDVALPFPTRVLLFMATWMKSYGLLAASVVLGIILLGRAFVAISPQVRLVWHRAKFNFPIVGKVIASSALSAFFRNLGVMLSAGLPLEYALKTEAKVAENLVIRLAAGKLLGAVSQGKRIGEELGSQNGEIFPKLCTQMITVGEMSGKLEESFVYLADFFEDEVETQAKNAAAFLEPVLLLVIGVVVGFVALAVILPIYSLTGSIHR